MALHPACRVPGIAGPAARILVLAYLLAAVPAPAWADWVRIETPNFIVYGDVSESRVRDVASELERFRDAMARVLPGAITRVPVPTVVVVFGTRHSYQHYRPLFNGKRVDSSGYFHAMEDENLVTLTIEDRELALRTVFHEYAHLIMSNDTWDMPVWASEGLAEYYGTFQLASNGREARLGLAIPSHLRQLSESSLLTLSELLGVTSDSPLYNEGNRRSVFYAESWALVHMLLSGEPDRSAELSKFVRAAARGVPPDTAWKDAFGSFDAITELKKYLHRATIDGRVYKFTQGVERSSGTAVKVSAAEAESALCDIVRRTEGPDEAAARLERSLALPMPSDRGRALLGIIRIEQQRDDEGRGHLLAAAANTSDWFVQYRIATGLRRLINIAEGSAAPDVLAAARRALEIVSAARPELAHTLSLEAEISAATRSDLLKGLTAIRRARALAPGRETYAFTEARLDTELGQFSEARAILEPMISTASTPEIREHARAVVATVARMEQSFARRGQPTANGTPRPPQAGGSLVFMEYRTVGPGEQRTEGTLEQIQCTRDGIVLQVRAGGRALRFEARSLDAVEFLSFRDDMSGAIVCGPRTPPDPVYVTWRSPLAGSRSGDGLAVAVEFLPK